jgi:hypothetical protein
MEFNLKYKKAFLIVAYGILVQFFILPLYEIPMLRNGDLKAYVIFKVLIACAVLFFIFCLHFLRLIRLWVYLCYMCCFSFVLIGQYFNPGYHFAVIQFMFGCAIIFDGFPWMSTLLMGLFMIEYRLLPFYHTTYPAYPFYHDDIFNALISSWVVSIALERYVSRVKLRQGFLDRKLRYKGIKTDLFMHDLKNQVQPLMFEYPDSEEFHQLVNTIQSFNSFQEAEEMVFEDVVMKVKDKFKIEGDCVVSGDDDFFIDQMDLQTILGNLMKNSRAAAQKKNIALQMQLKNTHVGFAYQDNAGGMTEEQFKFFNQKEFKPYEGHERKGLGLLLIKKLVEHHQGKFVIKKIPNGTRFEITY